MTTKRLSVTLDKALVEAAVQLSGAASQREAIDRALHEFVRRRRLDRLESRGGTLPLTRSVEELLSDRASR